MDDITGPTGSGKSTTLADLIEEINSQTAKHIISIEESIEYIYKSKKQNYTAFSRNRYAKLR